MSRLTIWHGTTEEVQALLAAIGNNCECGTKPAPCEAHRIMLEQRLIDRLLFMHRIAERLRAEEWRRKKR